LRETHIAALLPHLGQDPGDLVLHRLLLVATRIPGQLAGVEALDQRDALGVRGRDQLLLLLAQPARRV
ncbi:hypothetical protein LTS01_026057, partial [Friedmanniomyces endolithicus]